MPSSNITYSYQLLVWTIPFRYFYQYFYSYPLYSHTHKVPLSEFLCNYSISVTRITYSLEAAMRKGSSRFCSTNRKTTCWCLFLITYLKETPAQIFFLSIENNMFIQKYDIISNNYKNNNSEKWWLVQSYMKLKKRIVKACKVKTYRRK